MLQEGLFSFPENNGWFSSNTVANMTYFVIHYRIVRAYKILDDSFCTRIASVQLCSLTSRKRRYILYIGCMYFIQIHTDRSWYYG